MSKSKKVLIQECQEILNNPEVLSIIPDGPEYVHTDLTHDEIENWKNYLKGEIIERRLVPSLFNNCLRDILILKTKRPEQSWKMMAAGFGCDLYEWKEYLKLKKELLKIWKKHPKIKDRLIDEVKEVEDPQVIKNRLNNKD